MKKLVPDPNWGQTSGSGSVFVFGYTRVRKYIGTVCIVPILVGRSMTSGWLLCGSCCRYGACVRQIVASELSSCSIPCRKEYDKWVAAARKLLQIPGMRASDSVQ